MRDKLPWTKRIMYLIPVFLCITITQITVIRVTKIEEKLKTPFERSSDNLDLRRTRGLASAEN